MTELDRAIEAFAMANDDDPRLPELAEAVKAAMRRKTAQWN